MNQKPQAARLRLNGMQMNYMHPSTGGALTTTKLAEYLSDMLYEPPFVDDVWFKKKFITGELMSQEIGLPGILPSPPSAQKAKCFFQINYSLISQVAFNAAVANRH